MALACLASSAAARAFLCSSAVCSSRISMLLDADNVRCNVACTCAVVSTSLARARRRASTPLASCSMPERTSSCCDETPRSADDTSANACSVSALVGASTAIVGAAITSVDWTGAVAAAFLPWNPVTTDCCGGASVAGMANGAIGMLGQGGKPDGVCCVGC